MELARRERSNSSPADMKPGAEKELQEGGKTTTHAEAA
jgi:hypothetical protein